MKLITKPSVYLIGKQEIKDDELWSFLKDHEVSEWSSDTQVVGQELCEIAGRLCYMSYGAPRPGGNKAYIDRIIESQHGSVLEHAVYNLIFTGVSRSLTHELVRHRQGVGYSQLSQRYVDESVAEYVVPPELQKEVAAACRRTEAGDSMNVIPLTEEEKAGYLWLSALKISHTNYQQLAEYLVKRNTDQAYDRYLQAKKNEGLSQYAWDREQWWREDGRHQTTDIRKAARGAARSVLPNATETKIFVTMNARAARHMIEMRCSRHADAEIRILFGVVWEMLNNEAPNLFGDYQKNDLPDGTFEVVTKNRKV